MNNRGVTGRIYRPILTLSMRVFDPRDSAYTVNLKYDRHMHIYISCEISIEHPIQCVVSFPDPAFTDKGLAHFARNLGLPDLAGKE